MGHKDLGEGKTRSDLDNVQRGEFLQICPCASSTGPGRPTPTSPAVLQGLEEDLGYLVGDCLLAAAFLSYMGPFLTNYRDEIVNQIWIRKVRQGSGVMHEFLGSKITASGSNRDVGKGQRCWALIPRLKLWAPSTQISGLQVPCSPRFTFDNFLSNPTKVRDWNIQGLPSDAFSTENGIIVTRGNR